jgi:hypothetical protein
VRDARLARKLRLDEPEAGGAADTFQDQGCLACVGNGDGARSRPGFLGRGAARLVVGLQSRVGDRARHGFAGAAAERAFDAEEHGPMPGQIGERLATMEAA